MGDKKNEWEMDLANVLSLKRSRFWKPIIFYITPLRFAFFSYSAGKRRFDIPNCFVDNISRGICFYFKESRKQCTPVEFCSNSNWNSNYKSKWLVSSIEGFQTFYITVSLLLQFSFFSAGKRRFDIPMGLFKSHLHMIGILSEFNSWGIPQEFLKNYTRIPQELHKNSTRIPQLAAITILQFPNI